MKWCGEKEVGGLSTYDQDWDRLLSYQPPSGFGGDRPEDLRSNQLQRWSEHSQYYCHSWKSSKSKGSCRKKTRRGRSPEFTGGKGEARKSAGTNERSKSLSREKITLQRLEDTLHREKPGERKMGGEENRFDEERGETLIKNSAGGKTIDFHHKRPGCLEKWGTDPIHRESADITEILGCDQKKIYKRNWEGGRNKQSMGTGKSGEREKPRCNTVLKLPDRRVSEEQEQTLGRKKGEKGRLS